MTLVQAKSIAIYVLGLALVVLGALPQVAVIAGVHISFVAIGGVILAVERYLQGQIAIAAASAVKRVAAK